MRAAVDVGSSYMANGLLYSLMAAARGLMLGMLAGGGFLWKA